jgi:hypothetical protein
MGCGWEVVDGRGIQGLDGSLLQLSHPCTMVVVTMETIVVDAAAADDVEADMAESMGTDRDR